LRNTAFALKAGGKEEIPGDPEAAALLAIPRRKGYELPEA